MPIDPHLFKLYLVAVVVLILIPGPDSLLVLSRSLFEGRRAGLITNLGTTSGNVLHAALAALGVSALIAASTGLFEALRWAGACYLLWLGIRALHGAHLAWRTGRGATLPPLPPASSGRAYAQAFLTNILNPKIILFYLAFVPQFVAPNLGNVALQTFLLGLVLAFLAVPYHLALTLLASGIGRRLATNTRFRAALDGIAGLVFLGFALRLFLTERRTV